MAKDEEAIREKYAEMKAIEEKLKELQEQMKMVEQQMEDLMVSTQGLDDFEKIKKGTEILVPLSSGVFAKATVQDNKNLLVNVGAGSVVKKDLSSAKDILRKQMGELAELQQKIGMQLQKFSTVAQQVQSDLQKLAAKA